MQGSSGINSQRSKGSHPLGPCLVQKELQRPHLHPMPQRRPSGPELLVARGRGRNLRAVRRRGRPLQSAQHLVCNKFSPDQILPMPGGEGLMLMDASFPNLTVGCAIDYAPGTVSCAPRQLAVAADPNRTAHVFFNTTRNAAGNGAAGRRLLQGARAGARHAAGAAAGGACRRAAPQTGCI